MKNEKWKMIDLRLQPIPFMKFVKPGRHWSQLFPVVFPVQPEQTPDVALQLDDNPEQEQAELKLFFFFVLVVALFCFFKLKNEKLNEGIEKEEMRKRKKKKEREMWDWNLNNQLQLWNFWNQEDIDHNDFHSCFLCNLNKFLSHYCRYSKVHCNYILFIFCFCFCFCFCFIVFVMITTIKSGEKQIEFREEKEEWRKKEIKRKLTRTTNFSWKIVRIRLTLITMISLCISQTTRTNSCQISTGWWKSIALTCCGFMFYFMFWMLWLFMLCFLVWMSNGKKKRSKPEQPIPEV